VVSRAFQVLSDPDKKAKYDRFGGDPDSRFPGASAGAGGGASPFSGFGRGGGGGAQRGGPMWEEEISPEEMFRQFFGGGMGGGFGGPFGKSSCTSPSLSSSSSGGFLFEDALRSHVDVYNASKKKKGKRPPNMRMYSY
jgi:DnaJ family protein B protein 12